MTAGVSSRPVVFEFPVPEPPYFEGHFLPGISLALPYPLCDEGRDTVPVVVANDQMVPAHHDAVGPKALAEPLGCADLKVEGFLARCPLGADHHLQEERGSAWDDWHID